MSNELPRPIAYATHRGMKSLQQDDMTVFLYPNDYLIRPDQVHLYTADQMREYGRACERAAYERAMEACMITCAKNHADATAFGSVTKAYVAGCDDCHDAIRKLGADKCPDGLTPDGPVCPRCGGRRGPSGVDGGSWVHYQEQTNDPRPNGRTGIAPARTCAVDR